MAAAWPVPCPVRVGTVRDGGMAARLHQHTLDRNLRKMEKLLKKGVNVDCVNHLGQTALFCASLLGLTGATELLLQYGADPNHRCADMSTPVHAAAFSCNPGLLAALLDAGGDLRLHDHEGRLPQDWAEAGAQEHSPRMLSFLRSCVSHMNSLLQPVQPQALQPTGCHSCKSLLHSPSFLNLLRPSGSDLHTSSKATTSDAVQCYGFGKLWLDRPQKLLGLLACIPLISDGDLGQAEDEPSLSYSCSSFINMINSSWKGCRVTVKELKTRLVSQCAGQDGYQDQLIAEQAYCCRLSHPHLLQLLAVSKSADLLGVRLVFERVHVGSLHSLLHQRRAEVPVLQTGALLTIVLHVCEALLFLHGRGLVLRALSSHSVQIVHPAVAKVTGLSFMVPSDEGRGSHGGTHPPLPPELYNWAAPEVIRLRSCTGKADLYSACTLIQEFYTDAVPWGPVDPSWIQQAVDSGESLAIHPAVPQPYYSLVSTCLQAQAQDRTNSLQDLRYLLCRDIREPSRSSWRESGLYPEPAGLSLPGWGLEFAEDRPHRRTVSKESEQVPQMGLADNLLDREMQNQLWQMDHLLDREGGGVKNQLPGMDLRGETAEGQHISYRHPDPGILDEAGSVDDSAKREQISRHMGAIVLNLKVSQALMQQSEASLLAVEMREGGATSSSSWDARGFDEVDGPCPDQVARGGGVFGRAVGPPLCYHPPLCDVLEEDEWDHKVQDPSCGNEEPTCYFSAEEDVYADVLQVSANSRGGQRVGGGLQRAGTRGREDSLWTVLLGWDSLLCRKSAFPGATDSGRPRESSGQAEWKTEVSAAVARMTRGRLAGPRSFEGRGTEELLWSHDSHRPGTENSDPETLLNSFAGLQSESEEERDLLAVTGMFQAPLLGAAQESSSESESIGSPVESFSVFLTPNPRHSQSPSLELDLEATDGVCQPGAGGATEEAGLRGRRFAVEESAEARPYPASPGSFPAAGSCLSDLAELSSITCSPGQQQERACQALGSPAVSRRHSLCYSTPRSPVQSPRSRAAGSRGDPPPHLERPLNATSWTGPPTMDTFATASTSTVASDIPSMQQSPPQTDTISSHVGESGTTWVSESQDNNEPGTGPEHDDQVKAGDPESSPSSDTTSPSLSSTPEKVLDTSVDLAKGDHSAAAHTTLKESGSAHSSQGTCCPTGDHSLLEDTVQRVHSTLDEMLHDMLLEQAAGEKVAGSATSVLQIVPQH
ncbi:uncharacterized protein LOC125713260 [Brienomyrus brachyistius]|uniref:uncharacterized protein LOC125713260 n=1 Tax=Brienomyrus brachyistius TaxID=42636 RepID=UPI0020B247D9|nr:uncharacterized protein LOC125713260 [Brienomyrus brachyistius]